MQDDSDSKNRDIKNDRGSQPHIPFQITPIKTALLNYLDNLDNGLYGTGENVQTGFVGLDAMMGNSSPGDLVLVTAEKRALERPFLMNLIYGIAMKDQGIGVVTLDGEAEPFVRMLTAIHTQTEIRRLGTGPLDEYDREPIRTGINELSSLLITIIETPKTTIPQLRAECSRLIKINKLKALAIEGLEILQPAEPHECVEDDLDEVQGRIFWELRTMTHDLGIPVFVIKARHITRRQYSCHSAKTLRTKNVYHPTGTVISLEKNGGKASSSNEELIDVCVHKYGIGETGKASMKYNNGTFRFTEIDPADA